MTTPPKPPADALPVKATPRTDAKISPENVFMRFPSVTADFARQLETELRSSEAALAEARRERDNATEELADTFSQLKHSRRAMADRHEWEKSLNEVYDKMRAELTALRANAGLEAIGQRHTAERMDYVWWRTPANIPEGTQIYIKRTPPASLASGGEK